MKTNSWNTAGLSWIECLFLRIMEPIICNDRARSEYQDFIEQGRLLTTILLTYWRRKTAHYNTVDLLKKEDYSLQYCWLIEQGRLLTTILLTYWRRKTASYNTVDILKKKDCSLQYCWHINKEDCSLQYCWLRDTKELKLPVLLEAS